jgi:ABC-type polysaccharide/polyol phosphate transport system ATPase subunit/ABC-type polysaccharide/polyol phosphate export permease
LPLGISHYSSFVYSGLLPWTWFSAAVQTGSSTLLDNRDLVRKPFFVRPLLPVVVMGTNFLLYLLALPVLLVLLIIDGLTPTAALLLLPLVWVVQALFTLACAMFMAALSVVVRDMQHLLGIVLMMWFYLTPIFYNLNNLPSETASFFVLNPMAVIVQSHRTIALAGLSPDWLALAGVAATSILLLIFSYVVFRSLEDTFVERLGVILVEDLSKRYWLQGPAPRTFQEALLRSLGAARRRQPFWSLREVSFQIEPGESVGIIGSNGAGKSSLLRLICGLGRPTSGRVQVEGRVAALLELGAGFHPDLTGRQNLYISAIVSGLRRAEVDALYEEIVSFAEIEEFMDQPLRTYSAGMQLRLGFAVAIHVNPDILIIDEVLAVGDFNFQQKCLTRIEEFRQRGKTLLFVSHDMGAIRRFCNRAIWLRHGQLLVDGPTEQVITAYEGNTWPDVSSSETASPDYPPIERMEQVSV